MADIRIDLQDRRIACHAESRVQGIEDTA
jgi:hypothetical protein